MKLARIFSNKGSLSRNAKTQTQGKNMVRDRISFASRLKELRMIAHISQIELAEQLHVKNLILYHTEDTNLARRKELYTAEGQEYYKGNLFVPNDLEVFEL